MKKRMPKHVIAKFLPKENKIVFIMHYDDFRVEQAVFDPTNPLHQAIMHNLSKPMPAPPAQRINNKPTRDSLRHRSPSSRHEQDTLF